MHKHLLCSTQGFIAVFSGDARQNSRWTHLGPHRLMAAIRAGHINCVLILSRFNAHSHPLCS